MPKLSALVVFLFIQCILEFSVTPTKEFEEFRFVADLGEVKGLAGGEYDRLFWEVTVVWIVQTV